MRSAVACLDDDFEACIAHLRFPPRPSSRGQDDEPPRAAVRRGERRRTKVIPHTFGERAVLNLM